MPLSTKVLQEAAAEDERRERVRRLVAQAQREDIPLMERDCAICLEPLGDEAECLLRNFRQGLASLAEGVGGAAEPRPDPGNGPLEPASEPVRLVRLLV